MFRMYNLDFESVNLDKRKNGYSYASVFSFKYFARTEIFWYRRKGSFIETLRWVNKKYQ